MTIDDAIEYFSLILEAVHIGTNPFYIESVKLGIEAMKRLKENRHSYPHSIIDLLPGETEKGEKERW